MNQHECECRTDMREKALERAYDELAYELDREPTEEEIQDRADVILENEPDADAAYDHWRDEQMLRGHE